MIPRENGECTTLECRADSYEITDKQKRRRNILEIMILHNRPLTAYEIAQELFCTGKVNRIDRNYVAPRLTEMSIEGIVEPVGKKLCQETGRKITAYQVRKAI